MAHNSALSENGTTYSRTKSIGEVWPNLTPAAAFKLPRFTLVNTLGGFSDLDGDGLPDLAEEAIGTDPTLTDSDRDGVSDAAEVSQGTNPLDGKPARTGILASASTPGTAVDVCALNDIAIVAEGDAGLTVFDVFNGMNPVRIIQVDTPGNAQRVSCSGSLVAVADGPAGLAIIDISDPSNARISYQLDLGSPVQAVTVAGGIAYAGLAGEYLYALTSDALHTFSIQDSELRLLSSVNSPTFASGHQRLFVGSGIAYAVQNKGVNTISLADPTKPVLLTADNTTQFGWKQIVANGSGLGIAAVDQNLALDGPNDISLYDLRDTNSPPAFLTTFPTPGIAFAASIYNGLAYVADGVAGMQVVNYVAYDSKGLPPTIQLDASFLFSTLTNGVAEEGKIVRVTARVTDDVQVRNVEFYLDGVRVATDGNFPFEHRFFTPRIAPARNSFRVRARASDTGGNFTWGDEINVALTVDATAPIMGRTSPQWGSVSDTNVSSVIAFFNEPIDPASVTGNSFRLFATGSDNRVATSDDIPVPGQISYLPGLAGAILSFASPLAPGLYRMVLSTGIVDRVGNAMANERAGNFGIVLGGPSGDDDGDGLSNANELIYGLNPQAADTEGDTWIDKDELDNGSDGNDPNSGPLMIFVAQPPVVIEQPRRKVRRSAGRRCLWRHHLCRLNCRYPRTTKILDRPSHSRNHRSSWTALPRPHFPLAHESPTQPGSKNEEYLLSRTRHAHGSRARERNCVGSRSVSVWQQWLLWTMRSPRNTQTTW